MANIRHNLLISSGAPTLQGGPYTFSHMQGSTNPTLTIFFHTQSDRDTFATAVGTSSSFYISGFDDDWAVNNGFYESSYAFIQTSSAPSNIDNSQQGWGVFWATVSKTFYSPLTPPSGSQLWKSGFGKIYGPSWYTGTLKPYENYHLLTRKIGASGNPPNASNALNGPMTLGGANFAINGYLPWEVNNIWGIHQLFDKTVSNYDYCNYTGESDPKVITFYFPYNVTIFSIVIYPRASLDGFNNLGIRVWQNGYPGGTVVGSYQYNPNLIYNSNFGGVYQPPNGTEYYDLGLSNFYSASTWSITFDGNVPTGGSGYPSYVFLGELEIYGSKT